MGWWDEYAHAWAVRDPDRIAVFYAPDAVFLGALGSRFEGAEAIGRYIRTFSLTMSSDFLLETRTFFEAGERYCAEWTLSGTHDRDGMLGPATGKPFAVEGASIGVRSHGKIRFVREYWDSGGLLRQLGLGAPRTSG